MRDRCERCPEPPAVRYNSTMLCGPCFLAATLHHAGFAHPRIIDRVSAVATERAVQTVEEGLMDRIASIAPDQAARVLTQIVRLLHQEQLDGPAGASAERNTAAN